MPGLEKLKEDIICPSFDSTNNDRPNQNQNSSELYKNGHVNNTNNSDNNINYANIDGLIGGTTTKNSNFMSKSTNNNKLGFKKKSSSTSLKAKSDDPFRFAGDGVDFKSKLIGFQEVEQSKGDQMCQDAIQACKAIVKRKGEHKQRIIFNVSLDGLKIKDPSNGKILHSFPVSKVSFIAKDITDNRAFGLVYCVSEHEHHFYAIKTEKIADHVVFSIRDMFQIVYEMKKKQVEQAKQLQTQKTQNGREVINGKTDDEELNGVEDVPVANLLDLETELENLEQGMQNIDKWNSFNEETMANGLSQSPLSRAHSAYTSPDSSTWASNSLSSSAIAELNDPFADRMFTSSSTNSFSSSGPVSKESYVPPPPSNGHHTRRSSQGANGQSTLFGPPTVDPFVAFDFAENNNKSASVGPPTVPLPLFPAAPFSPPTVFQHQQTPRQHNFLIGGPAVSDPFDTSHIASVLNVANNQTHTNNVNNYAQNHLHRNQGVFFDTPHHVASTPVSADVRPFPTPGQGPMPQLTLMGAAQRFPSTIQPPPNTVASLSFEEYSPDKSVFSATSKSNGSSYSIAPTLNSTVFNNAINDTNVLRSFMGNEVSSIDWGSTGSNSCAMSSYSNPPPSGVPVNFSSSQTTLIPTPASSAMNLNMNMNMNNHNSNSNINNLGSGPAAGGTTFAKLYSLDGLFNTHNNTTALNMAPPLADSMASHLSHHSSMSHLPVAVATTIENTTGAAENVHNLSTSNVLQGTPREDPFAHLRQKPPAKRTINELREMASGPNLEPLEHILTSNSCNNKNFGQNCNPINLNNGPNFANNNNENSKNVLNGGGFTIATPPPPAIPPRVANQQQPQAPQINNFPVIPKPPNCGNSLRNGHHQPTNRNGGNFNWTNEVGGGNGVNGGVKDPFADDFFS